MKLIALKEKLIDVPEINVEKGFKYCVGNANNYKKSLMIAVKSSKAKLPLMYHMIDTGEYEGLRIIAHTMVNIMDAIAAESISTQALELETCVLNCDMEKTYDLLSQFVSKLEQFISRLEIAVRTFDTRESEVDKKEEKSYMNYDFSKTKELLAKEYSQRSKRVM